MPIRRILGPELLLVPSKINRQMRIACHRSNARTPSGNGSFPRMLRVIEDQVQHAAKARDFGMRARLALESRMLMTT